MKYKYLVEKMSDVQMYPLISLVLFTCVFAIVILYAFTADKNKMKKNAEIPLN